MVMNIKRWISRRETHWQRLEALLNQVQKRGLPTLSAAEIQELASLYRSVSGDLARAQTHKVGPRLTATLQELTTQGYHQIYQGQKHQEWAAVREFVLWGFPAAVQRNGGYVAIATLLFLLGSLIGWWFSWRDPEFISLMLPDWLIAQVRDEGKLWMGSIILGSEPVESANIMINNLRVCFTVIAGGVTAGLLTIYILLLNGILIGTAATLVTQHGLAWPFWGFVWPHGAWELPAIFIAGGAGLLIARALVWPGQYRRRDALQRYGQEAVQLLFGVVGLLVGAGVIEAFISPQPWIPDIFKYLFGMGLLTGLIAYCQRSRPLNPD